MKKLPSKKIQVRNASQAPLFTLDRRGNPHTRRVWSYDDEAQEKQREALRALRSVKFPMPLATGSVPGKTLYDNVRPHRQSTRFYTTDFIDAFGSVQREVMEQKVDALLRKYARGRSNEDVRNTIRSYLDEGAFLEGVDGLPQGNITSQDLFNWYMMEADNALSHMLWLQRRRYGEVATRYLDDLTVSSIAPDGVNASTRKSVRAIYENLAPGMQVSHPKSALRHLNGDHPAITITGLSLYKDGRITPSRELLGAAKSVFDDISQRLADEEVTDEDYWLVAGYNGVLQMPGESDRSGSRLVREMGVTARDLMARLGQYTT